MKNLLSRKRIDALAPTAASTSRSLHPTRRNSDAQTSPRRSKSCGDNLRSRVPPKMTQPTHSARTARRRATLSARSKSSERVGLKSKTNTSSWRTCASLSSQDAFLRTLLRLTKFVRLCVLGFLWKNRTLYRWSLTGEYVGQGREFLSRSRSRS